MTREDSGWPLLAAYTEHYHRNLNGDRSDEHRALTFANAMAPLPVVVLWPGFALDTAFYGTLAFALWSAPGFVRRQRRRRGGRCLACGYELKGIAKCPECGEDA